MFKSQDFGTKPFGQMFCAFDFYRSLFSCCVWASVFFFFLLPCHLSYFHVSCFHVMCSPNRQSELSKEREHARAHTQCWPCKHSKID